MEIDHDVAYVYDGTLEGLLSAVFLAYARKQNPVDVADEAVFAPRLGQEVVHVETNMSHAQRVRAGIVRTCGRTVFDAVTLVCASDDVRKGAAVLSFIRYAMKRGRRALDDVAHPDATLFAALNRSVSNERHQWQQFLRFSKVEGGVYVARCNPKANVVPLLMDWFAMRFNTQPFLIYDEVHDIAGVSYQGQWRMVRTDALAVPPPVAEDAFVQEAWRTFYRTIAVEARYNPELRRTNMPKRMWKNIVEVQDRLPAEQESARTNHSLCGRS